MKKKSSKNAITAGVLITLYLVTYVVIGAISMPIPVLFLLIPMLVALFAAPTYLEDGKITKEYSMKEIQNLSEEERLRTGLRHTEFHSDDFKRKSNSLHNVIELEINDLFYKRKKQTIFKIGNLKFEKGNIVGIVGNNGIGKSTFAKIVCGLEKQSSGTICKDNIRLSSKDRVRKSLLVMQEIALLSNKNLLFFDEPTSGSDYASMKVVAENIKKFKEKKNLILIISHDIEFLEEVCDSVVFSHD